MRGFHLNRKQKILRNLLACGLLGLAVYAMLGFPPYTVRGMLARAEREYLLSDLEPVLAERTESTYSTGILHDTDYNTHLLARTAEDTYIYVWYRRNFLKVRELDMKMGRGALCTAVDGTLYVAGPFQNAAAATAEVTAQKTTQYVTQATDTRETVRGETRTFTLQGERAGEALFTFRYRGEDHRSYDVPESEYDLENAAEAWYSVYLKDPADEAEGQGRGILHADLPVHVTLYGGDGAVLDTLDLTVDNYELFFRH